MDYFNTDGHLNDSGIALYADAIKLNKVSELPKAFKEHLASCSICQHHVVDFTAIMADIKQEASAAHPYFDAKKDQAIAPQEKSTSQKSSGNIRSLLYRLAVAAVLGALVFIAYRQFNIQKPAEIVNTDSIEVDPKEDQKNELIQPIPEKEELVVENDAILEEQNKNTLSSATEPDIEPIIEKDNRVLFAANYIPNDEMESMLGTTVRSESFPVEAPQNGLSFKEKQGILFKWQNNIKLNLTILDNQEEEVFVKEIEGERYDFENKLNPGVYYWKLETEEDLLHLGKFIVE